MPRVRGPELPSAGPCRKAAPLRADGAGGYKRRVPPAVLAVDIGGTKLAAAVVDGQGTILGQARILAPRTLDADVLFASLDQVCRQAMADAGVACEAIGIGAAGPAHYQAGVISPANLPAWRDFPIVDRLTAAFGLPCAIANDAQAVAVGERWLGAGRGFDNLIGMVVSTGVGGGLIVDGRLIRGARGNAGHLGHIVVWPDGPPCGCGGRGCVEAIAAGPSIVRRLAVEQAAGVATTLRPGATTAEIADAARAGDALAWRLFREAGEALGRGIGDAVVVADVDLVAIGGGVAVNAWDLLEPPLEAALRATAQLEFARGVRVARALLGDHAGLVGAAALALDRLGARQSGVARPPVSRKPGQSRTGAG